MKNKILVIVLLLVFIGLLVFATDFLKTEDDNSKGKVEIRDSAIAEESKYVLEVNDENFKEEVLDSDKKVLIDFYATWCEPCKMLSPIVEEVAKENEDIKFVRVDVDKCTELASEYGIQYMPTLVLVEGSEEVNRSIGLINKDKLLEFLGK